MAKIQIGNGSDSLWSGLRENHSIGVSVGVWGGGAGGWGWGCGGVFWVEGLGGD